MQRDKHDINYQTMSTNITQTKHSESESQQKDICTWKNSIHRVQKNFTHFLICTNWW